MLTLRYALELSVIIPALIFAFMPVIDSLKVRLPIVFWVSGISAAVMISAGSFFGVKYGLRVRDLLLSFSAVIFAAYMLVVDSDA